MKGKEVGGVDSPIKMIGDSLFSGSELASALEGVFERCADCILSNYRQYDARIPEAQLIDAIVFPARVTRLSIDLKSVQGCTELKHGKIIVLADFAYEGDDVLWQAIPRGWARSNLVGSVGRLFRLSAKGDFDLPIEDFQSRLRRELDHIQAFITAQTPEIETYHKSLVKLAKVAVRERNFELRQLRSLGRDPLGLHK